MLRAYHNEAARLVQSTLPLDPAGVAGLVWLDLLQPTAEEDRLVEQLLGIDIPSQAEMEEIELSARLYSEDGAEFMTMTGLHKLDSEEPSKTPITFILKGETLVTVRYAEPKPFLAFTLRAQKSKSIACSSGEQVFLGLLEAMIDRTADALERVGNEIDQISRDVFGKKSSTAKQLQQDLRSIIERIGAKAELLTMVQESLVSISRLMAFHIAPNGDTTRAGRDARQLVKLIQRDAVSLGEHARTLSSKINFLLDATLGLINLEQNQIIKIFSVAAVVFLPPTLVASIYGMNYDIMPELKWEFGYPFAIGLMILSAVLPYLYFKKRGWL
ncbi:putative magnesium and cobalt transport transmembrane protein [Devosia sp. LC5]|uniref:magnesium/cobalt transporter CorA n=1 Tax=Devosia sp. LC5 TaxID=1502724 RepID=UPI0004E420E0|nr:magnesium/cobalt transporter CorA [Devosia sp. LC5]KFC62482.1 putative magnesium and cobalt transport transmembrane protein [Devosia sp. LC5]